MKIAWNIRYSSAYAYVSSILRVGDWGKGFVLSQTNDSYRSIAIYKFCFDGKVVKVTESGLQAECDELDEEFLKLTKLFSTREWVVWSTIVDMLFKKKCSRKEVIDYLKTLAISKKLKP